MAPSFDERAATWDEDPAKVERARDVAAAIRGSARLDRSMRVLEYGAGTGLLTQALRDDVGPVTLADTSAGMRAVIDQKIAAGALAGARVWDIDLSTSPPPPGETFDLVVTVMTLHHIADVDAVLAAFAALTRPGGHLCIADLEEEDGSFHGEGFTGHHGFARDWLAERLERAGYRDVTFRTVQAIERERGRFPLFLATARRAG